MSTYAADPDSPFPPWLQGDSLAPFCPAEPKTVAAAVSAAQVSASDFVVDLGCGDGRILIAAAQAGAAKCVGVEIEPDVAELARKAVADAGLSDRVDIWTADARRVDLGPVTCVFVYLLPEATSQMSAVYKRCLARGARIVSVLWDIPSLGTPVRVDEAHGVFVYSEGLQE